MLPRVFLLLVAASHLLTLFFVSLSLSLSLSGFLALVLLPVAGKDFLIRPSSCCLDESTVTLGGVFSCLVAGFSPT